MRQGVPFGMTLEGEGSERLEVNEDSDGEGQRLHYFVKPHMALEGQTPAERVGVGVDGENKWMELLKKAILNEQT